MSTVDEQQLRAFVEQHGDAKTAMRAAVIGADLAMLCRLLDEYGGEPLIEYVSTDAEDTIYYYDWSTALHGIVRTKDRSTAILLLRAVIPYCEPEWWTEVREKSYHQNTLDSTHDPPIVEWELEEGSTVLELAVDSAHALHIVPILAQDAHADMCATDKQRQGVLFLHNDDPDRARMLVEMGADPYATNCDGRTVMDSLKWNYRHLGGPGKYRRTPQRLHAVLEAMGVVDD